jgi:hypothetical protein
MTEVETCPVDLSSIQGKSITEDEVSECISEKVDDGVPQDQAVAICLSEAEEGSTEPVNREVTVDSSKKSVLTDTVLVPDQLLYRERSTAELVAEMLDLDGVHTHELGDTTYFMPGDSHEQFFEVLGEPGVEGLVDENMTQENDATDMEEVENDGKSLEDPQYSVGDYLRWDFASGTAEGEVIERATDPGDSLSAGGNEFTVDEEGGDRDVPLYKLQEWDDSEGEEGEFTNNVVKFEDELREVQRPDAAPASAPRNRSKSTGSREKRRHNFRVKGSQLELTKEDDDGVYVNVPIQAVSEDRDGDIITDKGQESIMEQLNSGEVPLVPNHGVGSGAATYDFRDIFGQFVGGEMMDGTTVGRARLREGSEMADELHDLLEQDMPVGFSVGFIPTETEERGEGGMLVDDLDLMEVSAVGVPSNPDAVPQAMGGAVAAAKQAGYSKKEIQKRVEKAFEGFDDSMTGKDTENEDGKTSENLKMMAEEDVEAVMSAVGGALDSAMDEAMDEMRESLMAMMEDGEDMEEDGSYGSDDEDMEEDEMDEDMEEDSLSDDEKTVSSDSSGKTIQGVDDSSAQNENQGEKESEGVDSLMSEPEGSGWGTVVSHD